MRTHWLLLTALLAPLAGHAQQAASCPAHAEVGQRDLLGMWRAQVDGQPADATLLLEAHPEYAQGFSGGITRNGRRSQVAGDVDEGEFTLEESADGLRISATWLGDVVPGTCGREIRGTWRMEGADSLHPFVLRKNP